MWGDRTGSAWHDDYVVDVEYTDPLMPWINPAHLSMACVLAGQPPLPSGRPLVWAELGCGNGLQACAVAAGDPTMEVWACDFNPAHVERARRRAESAGLANCTFVEASFQQLIDDPSIGPAQVDVVVAHGVFTWVSKHNQALIGEFIRRRLRPGGVVYMAYSTSTGWSSISTLAETMRLHARASRLRSDVAVVEAAADVRRLADAGASFFPLAPRERNLVDLWDSSDPRYLAHDFLVGRYEPVMFDEVAAVMAAAQCVYVGDSRVATENPVWRSPDRCHQLVDEARDAVEYAMLCDIAVGRGFRCDVFRRGDQRASDADVARWLADLHLVATGKQLESGAVAPLQSGDIGLDVAFVAPIVEAAAAQPVSALALRAIRPELTDVDLRYITSLLVRGGYLAPQARGWRSNGAVESCRAFNAMVIGENDAGANHSWLLVPATGSFVEIDPVASMALGASWRSGSTDPEVLAEIVLDQLRSTGRTIRENGVLLEETEHARPVAVQRAADALTTMRDLTERFGLG